MFIGLYMNEVTLIKRLPTVGELKFFHEAVGWDNVDDAAIATALKNSLFGCVIAYKGRTIGCGRVIGDGGMYFYIQDIIVLPEYRGRGIGRLLMNAVMEYLGAVAKPNAFIGLMSAKDKSGFYLKFGFTERPPGRPGMFRVWK
jgi:ribosomal protein S18 acetylase RimI-like enzyme